MISDTLPGGPETAGPGSPPDPPPDVTLLVMNLGPPDELLRLLGPLLERFAETVVVDSSPSPFSTSAGTLPGAERLRVVRVVPIAYQDPLLPFAVAQCRPAWALLLDVDERPTGPLLSRLRRLGDADGYVVPRWEASLGATTYHLRLFRPRAFRPQDPAYGFPRIEGTVLRLRSDERIEHARDYSGRPTGPYYSRLMWLESMERPLTRAALMRATFGRRAGRLSGRAYPSETTREPLPGPVLARACFAFSWILTTLRTGSPRFASFRCRYDLARLAYLSKLPDHERQERLRLTRDIQEAGGMIRYLGFDDPAYVARLTSDFDWKTDGTAVLDRLIRYRAARGAPLPRWAEPTQTDRTG